MRAEQQFFTAAVGSPAVVAIVGQHVYPEVSPEGLLPPLVIYERRSSIPVTTIHDDLRCAAFVSVAATCWARTRIEAEQLADLLEVALRDVGGTMANRFAHFDEQKESYASVIDFDMFEVGP